MKNKILVFEYLLLPVFLLLMITLLALWFDPEITTITLMLLPLWVFFVSLASYLACKLVQKNRFKSSKMWLIVPGVIILWLLAWFLSLRISSFITTPTQAWDGKWISLAIVTLYFVCDFTMHYLIRENRANFNILENQVSMKEHELDIMKNQLSPHFLFNSLNNIAATIMVDKEMALDYIYKLSELLRFQNGISGKETVPVEDEIAFIRNFLNIEKFRLGDRCDISFNAEIENPLTPVPPLLLHPFIEHSLRKSLGLNGKSFVDIHISSGTEFIRMKVRNSLPESPAYKKLTGTGVAMLKKRLNLLFPESHELRTSKKKTEYVLELDIRLTNEKP